MKGARRGARRSKTIRRGARQSGAGLRRGRRSLSSSSASVLRARFPTRPRPTSRTGARRKSATGFIRAARPIIIGVRTMPSRLVIPNAAPLMYRLFARLSNCMKATRPSPPVTSIGPRYGIELKRPASRPHMAKFSRPNAHKTTPVTQATMRLVMNWTLMKLSICSLISSRICTVTLFFASVGPAIFTSLRLYRSPVTSRK